MTEECCGKHEEMLSDCICGQCGKTGDVEAITDEEYERLKKEEEAEAIRRRLERRQKYEKRHIRLKAESLAAEEKWAKENKREIYDTLGNSEMIRIMSLIESEGGVENISLKDQLKLKGATYPAYDIENPDREKRPDSLRRKYRIASQCYVPSQPNDVRPSKWSRCQPMSRFGTLVTPQPDLGEGMRRAFAKIDAEKAKDPALLKNASIEQLEERLAELKEQEKKFANVLEKAEALIVALAELIGSDETEEEKKMFKKDGETKVYKDGQEVSPKNASGDAERYTIDDLVEDSEEVVEVEVEEEE